MDTTGQGFPLSILQGEGLTQPEHLLPYERDLIAHLGISEEEYQAFTAAVRSRSGVRPAAYDHVPDVRNEVVSIIVTLVIGIALQALGSLLTPAPEKPKEQGKTRKLQSSNQSDRFNQTFGFDQLSELGTYGDPIALVFGRFEPGTASTEPSGGIQASPDLVWSRMFSYGTYQVAKLLYSVGEYGITAPRLQGIYIGKTPLSVIYKQQFALYWSSQSGLNRIKAANLLYGTRGDAKSGDPERTDDIFLCPTDNGPQDTGFSGAYSQGNSTQFGCYGAIANGSAYRVNWRIVSRLDMLDSESHEQTREERKKIAGTQGAGGQDGMPGTGRGYSRRMGLIAWKPQGQNRIDYELPTVINPVVGDRLWFAMLPVRSKDEDDFKFQKNTITGDDINDYVLDGLIAADDEMQLGELFTVGRNVFQVVNRPSDVLRRLVKEEKAQWREYELECIENLGDTQIGVAGTRAIINAITHEGGEDNAGLKPYFVGPSYWPLLRISMATVRSMRPADVIEIGIKSQVFNRANGLCNFASLLKPDQVAKLDRKDTPIQSGTMTRYFERTSVFTIHVRPAKPQADGTEYRWHPIGEQFCVTGNRPVQMFNYLRINPQFKELYEFRLVPRPGAASVHLDREDEQYIRLQAQSQNYITINAPTPYGNFEITTSGEWISNGQLQLLREMVSGAGGATQSYYEERVNRLSTLLYYLPPNTSPPGQIVSVPFRDQAWKYEFLGDPHAAPLGTVRRGTRRLSAHGAWVDVQIEATIVEDRNDLYYYNRWGTYKKWRNEVYNVTDSSSGWTNGETQEFWFNNASNKFLQNVGAAFSLYTASVLVPGSPGSKERRFESETGVADLSFYQELDKSNAAAPEHEITYINECKSNDTIPTYNSMTMLGLSIKSSRAFRSIDQINLCISEGIDVFRLLDNKVGPSNLFADLVHHILTDRVSGLGSTISPELIDKNSFAETAKYLNAMRIRFDGVIANRTNIRSYLNEVAQLSMCSFTIKNGRFGMMPALPVNSAGTLETGAVRISGTFSAGVIVEGSLKFSYIEYEQRRDIRAVMKYRTPIVDRLPEMKSMQVRWAANDAAYDPQQEYDLSAFCTTQAQAFLTARYLLALRRHVDHAVEFKTTPHGMTAEPGQLIKVYSDIAPYSAAQNGYIDRTTGTVVSATQLADGNYPAYAYESGWTEPRQITLSIVGGKEKQQAYWGVLFSLDLTKTVSSVYAVEEVSLDEEGFVDVKASHHPVDDQGRSLIIKDILNTSNFQLFL